MMSNDTRWLARGAVVLACLLTQLGCAGESPRPEAETTPVEGRLVAAVRLSETHVLEAWEYEPGFIFVREDLDVDHDMVPGRVMLANTDITGMTLVQTFKMLAGAMVTPETLEGLEAADGRVAVARAHNAENPGPKLDEVAGSELGPTELPDAPAPGAVTQGALHAVCPAPSNWDWSGDDGWFKNNFCFANSKACFTSANNFWVQYGYNTQPWFKATGFAQAFCNTARFRFWWKKYAGGIGGGIVESNPINVVLEPRHLNSQSWVDNGATVSWKARMDAVSSPEQIRLGLSIHHPPQ